MSIKSQKRMAAEFLNSGVTRVWINPEYLDRVKGAITRDEIKTLIHEGVIKKRSKIGISKGRIKEKKRTSGHRKGRSIKTKRLWIHHIRKQRKRLKELRDGKNISKNIYRKIYLMAKGGTFRSVSRLNEYLESNNLIKKR